jgi:hypothetical protein
VSRKKCVKKAFALIFCLLLFLLLLIFDEFFRIPTLKKLPRTAYEFSRGPGPRVKAFLLRSNVDLKIRGFKTVDRKNFKKVQGFLTHFFHDNVPLRKTTVFDRNGRQKLKRVNTLCLKFNLC